MNHVTLFRSVAVPLSPTVAAQSSTQQLNARIGSPVPAKYLGIRDSKGWLNPYIVVCCRNARLAQSKVRQRIEGDWDRLRLCSSPSRCGSVAGQHEGAQMMKSRIVLGIALAGCIVVSSACAALGYSNRVLWRVPSPDGQFVAVCQEIPAFDGPGYDVRLETHDGSVIRQLYQIGDGDGCSEVVWSADGRTLAILTGHVARIKFVDVSWALDHREIRTAYWRDVDLSTEQTRLVGADLQFVGPTTVQLNVCEAVSKNSQVRCQGKIQRFDVPTPIVTGHRREGEK